MCEELPTRALYVRIGHMKISTFLATSLGVFLLAGAANAATYTATLTGAQAGNTTDAKATATLDFDEGTKVLSGSIVYENFTIVPTQANVHSGACEESGTNVKSIVPDTGATAASGIFSLPIGTAAGPLVLDADQETALVAGNLFATISTDAFAFPLYEIRGQIVADGAANTLCGTAGTDAGTDSGTTPTTDAGSDDNTTPTTTPTTTVDDSSGCNTSGSSSPGSSAALALGLGLALYGMARKRKQA